MRVLALLCIAALLPGCAAQSVTTVRTGGFTVTSVPLPGTSAYSASVNAYVASSSAWGALAGIALLGFAFHGPYSGHWDDQRGFVQREYVPELAPDRVVHEQDCSKPIENPRANLRCK